MCIMYILCKLFKKWITSGLSLFCCSVLSTNYIKKSRIVLNRYLHKWEIFQSGQIKMLLYRYIGLTYNILTLQNLHIQSQWFNCLFICLSPQKSKKKPLLVSLLAANFDSFSVCQSYIDHILFYILVLFHHIMIS